LKDEGKEYPTLKLYGQEINLITSAIARMNMFMHGIEEFSIVRGDTLANPAFLQNDELKKFNVILANPPYSIKAWDRKSFESDPFGRNIWGTPPQGTADYAFQQHIQTSLDPLNGRSISLWPHGILFRDSEADMRRKMIESDVVECVIGLGPNLFYNSPMEACLLITKNNKEKKKKGKILFINAVHEVRQDKSVAFLDDVHIQSIFTAYKKFNDVKELARVVGIKEVMENNGKLAINLYVRKETKNNESMNDFSEVLEQWERSSEQLKNSMEVLFETLETQ
jgi:type I restriction enzyme M protein